MRRRPLVRAIFILTASASSFVLAAAFAGAFYLFGVKHYQYATVRPMFRFAFVRAYLLDAKFRRLLDLAAAQDADVGDTFAIVWDARHTELLARRVFQPVEMDGITRYMYKPGARTLRVVAGAKGVYREFAFEDTAAIRDALKDLDVRMQVSASYDENGFRRPDPDLTRDCTLHVLFVGDSFTDAIGVNDSETFVNRFGRFVRERSHVAVCPVNSGVEGYSTEEEAWVLEHRFATAGWPGIVFVMHYANDIDAEVDALVDGTLPELEAKWSSNLSLLARMSSFCRRQGATMVLAAIPPKRQMTGLGSRRHYQDRLRQWADANGVAFVDLLDGFIQSRRGDLYLDPDEHLSAQGHAVAAEILYTHAVGWLAGRRDVAPPAVAER